MGWNGGIVASGEVDTGITLGELQAELNARNVTANRLGAIIRLADGLAAAMSTSNATYQHQNNVNEQDVLEVQGGVLPEHLSLDCNNLTQSSTFRIYEKVDGVNYRLVNSLVFPTEVPANAKVVNLTWSPKGRDVKVTLQSAIVEGSIKNVPYARRTGN